jgi:hypothetical protein
MKTARLALFALATTVGVLSYNFAFADHDHSAMAQPSATTKDADWLAQAKAAYPLDTCVVSDEKLEGDMGGPVDYIHKEEGKPDRLVRFCCKNCVKDFKKNPQKYLSKIDAAAAKKAK